MASAPVPAAPQPPPAAASSPAFTVKIDSGKLQITVGGVARNFGVKIGGKDITDQQGLEKAKKLMEKYLAQGDTGTAISTNFGNVKEIKVGPKGVDVTDDTGTRPTVPIKTKGKGAVDIPDFTVKLVKYTKEITDHIKYVDMLNKHPAFKKYSPAVQDAAIQELMSKDRGLNTSKLFENAKASPLAKEKAKKGREGLVSALNSFRTPQGAPAAASSAPVQADIDACVQELETFVDDNTQ